MGRGMELSREVLECRQRLLGASGFLRGWGNEAGGAGRLNPVA